MFPSALNNASLFANILKHLSSSKAIRSVSLACSFCIDPYIGLRSLVILSPAINWFNSFTPLVLLNIPLYIKPADLRSSVYGSSSVVETLTPLVMVLALKSSLILSDSTPLPKLKQLKYGSSISTSRLAICWASHAS